jgi:DNA-binding MarR family transcriptional regulator
MPQDRSKPTVRLAQIEQRRARNLRQLLLRASRIVNRHVVEELQMRGYADLRATHTTLLSNIDLAGSTVTEAAERAGITKQAMGRLASELQAAGYIRVADDPDDARVKALRLTASGRRLMLESFDVMARLEARYATALGQARFTTLLRALQAFVAQLSHDQGQAAAARGRQTHARRTVRSTRS